MNAIQSLCAALSYPAVMQFNKQYPSKGRNWLFVQGSDRLSEGKLIFVKRPTHPTHSLYFRQICESTVGQ